MENIEQKISEIITKSPLPIKMKEYFQGRLQKEGPKPILIESIKSALRAVEADAFGRMGVSVDESDDPEIKRAIKMYSAAVEEAVKKYLQTTEEVSGKVSKANAKTAKKLENLQAKVMKHRISV